MANEQHPSRNIGLDLVRVTETTALAAGRWAGSGNYESAHRAATRAMREALDTLEMDGRIVVGEENRLGEDLHLCKGEMVGNGRGPAVDLVVDPIDGTKLLVKGMPGAVSFVAVAPRNTLWSPVPAIYMDKIIVDKGAASALVPECLDAPAAWTLALVARAKGKAIHDVTVVVLNRPRNKYLIEEIRAAGARVLLQEEGDSEGALVAAVTNTSVDMLMGIGGAAQGLMAACITKATDGAMLGRVAPQSEAERQAVEAAGIDLKRIFTEKDLVAGDEIFLAVSGITQTRLLDELQFFSDRAVVHSLLIRSETRTRRFILAEHFLPA